MPIYEYVCSKCGTFEQIQKVSDSVLKKCPTCRRKVTKKISTPALHFKGEGFWVTDYGWKSKNKEGGAPSPPGSGDGGSTKEGGAKDSGAKESATKAGGATESAAPTSSTTGTAAPKAKAKDAKRS